MICNSCKKYSVRSDMEAIGLCVHCLALAGKDREIADLKAQVAEAVQLLREGKAMFAPHTTNSDVDMFIKRHEAKAGGE